MTWRDNLSQLIAEREAWQRQHGPRLSARDAASKARRERVAFLLRQGLEAIGATGGNHATVFAVTGIAG